MTTILVIEDDPVCGRLLKDRIEMALPESVPEVYLFASIKGALTLYEMMQIDLIMLDLNLDDTKGVNTYRLLKRHVNGTPVIVYTGDDTENGYQGVANILATEDFIFLKEPGSLNAALDVVMAAVTSKLSRNIQQIRTGYGFRDATGNH